MKKIIKQMTNDKSIMQITIADERWYVKQSIDDKQNPIMKYVPNMTWIASYYPKGTAYYKWLAEHGWDEAETIKREAGEKGSKVHKAIETLLQGKEVKIDDKFVNPTTEIEEEITLDEWQCIVSFQNWYEEEKPEIVQTEFVVFSDKYNYAGTVDCLCKLSGVYTLVDWKTSANIWVSHMIQINGYKQAFKESYGKHISIESIEKSPNVNMGILQLGYKKNKKGYKYTPIDEDIDLVLTTKKIWENENNDKEPKTIELPTSIKLSKYKGDK